MPSLSASSYTPGTDTSLTVTLNNPSTTAGANPNGVTFDVLGTQVQATFDANDQATLDITVDASLATFDIPVTITPQGGDGTTHAIRPNLGRSGGNLNNMQVLKASGGGYAVYPVLKAILRAHYFGALASNPFDQLDASMQAFQALDISGQVDANAQADIIAYITPAKLWPTDTAKQNGFAYWQKNIQPSLKYHFGNIIDSKGNPVPAIAEWQGASGNFEKALNAYESAVTAITAAGGTLN